MRKTSAGVGNCAGLATALICFVVGIVITVTLFWTIIGAVIGIAMMVGALFMGGNAQKVWKCRQCGSIVPRA